MSRTTSHKTPPPPSRARAETLIRAGHIAEALEVSRELFAKNPNEENLSHRKQILTAAVNSQQELDRPIETILAEADKLTPQDAGWIRTRAGWLAKMGRFEEASQRVASLNDPADLVRLTQLVADHSVRKKSYAILAAEHHAGLASVLNAFQAFEAGNDDETRACIQAIGLQSPFLEWKVLLRGLLAHANQEPSRAIENWSRLDSNRLPAQLAAPLRFAIDPTFRDQTPDLAREDLRRRSERLMEGSVLQGLRDVRKNLGREGSLASAFRDAGSFISTLKRLAPDLAQRLGDCFYHAIEHHGRPEDLARYRTTFGPPLDDPIFDRLEAMILEAERAYEEAHKHWERYANWLAAPPPTWPKDVANRARALVWFRMALNAHRASQVKNPFRDAFEMLFDPVKKPVVKELKPNTISCLQHAIDLAPDWHEPPLRLVQELFAKKQFAKAEQTALAHLERNPNDLVMLKELGSNLLAAREFEKSLPIWDRALALQPLDRDLQIQRNFSLVSDIRLKSAKADPLELLDTLEARKVGLEETFLTDLKPIEAILTLKAGKKDEATTLIDEIVSTPHQRLAGPYRLAVEALLAGLKPAMKAQATKRFKDALALEPSPREILELILAVKRYETGGFEYRGAKTHEKQSFALIARTLKTDHPARDYGLLAAQLETLERWKDLSLLARACCQKFPKEGIFVYFDAAAMLHTGKREFYVEKRLYHARKLAETLEPGPKKILLGKIEDLQKEISHPLDSGFFDDFEDDNG